MKETIIIAGGSGFLGIALAERLAFLGYAPVILSRHPELYNGRGTALHWDGKTLHEGWVKELGGAKAIINLAGKNVNCRPSKKNREKILSSRVDSVTVLGEAIRQVDPAPATWIQAGSLAIYGDAGERICDESTRVADYYPANVCLNWEGALGGAIRPEMRWVNHRIGFVLGTDGGALPFLARLTRLGLGGSIGSGSQFISWIHLEDMLRIFVESIENPEFKGTYHATGPEPVTNRDFMATLRSVLGRPWSPPVPALAIRIGAPFLDSDPEIALTGRRCVPRKLISEGFSFHYPELKPALSNLYNKTTTNT